MPRPVVGRAFRAAGTGAAAARGTGGAASAIVEKMSTGRLAGKVAIVTGGNSGMGAATVERYVAEGARVTIAARSDGPGRELARRLGDSAMFVRTDVTVEADVQAMVEATVQRWGRLDVLFNNAGSGHPYHDVDAIDIERFQQDVMVLLGSCFLGVKHAAPIMKRQRGGSIINNGSTAGVTTDGSSAEYSACKAAVIHVTKVWATELAEHRVRVNSISPGAIITPIFWGGQSGHTAEENAIRSERLTRWFEDTMPQGRAGQGDDIAHAAVYLASDESVHVTGVNLMVDGGLTAARGSRAQFRERFEGRAAFLAGTE